jgi:hypothetical protein
MRRPHLGSSAAGPGAPRALRITPRDNAGPLPEWLPPTPSGGWTPRAAAEAAVRYGETHAESLGIGVKRLSSLAHRELLNALPDVKREEIIERLSGVDWLADYFDLSADASPEAPPF